MICLSAKELFYVLQYCYWHFIFLFASREDHFITFLFHINIAYTYTYINIYESPLYAILNE